MDLPDAIFGMQTKERAFDVAQSFIECTDVTEADGMKSGIFNHFNATKVLQLSVQWIHDDAKKKNEILWTPCSRVLVHGSKVERDLVVRIVLPFKYT